MKRLCSIIASFVALGGFSAPTVSYPAATNIADTVTRKVVTRQYVKDFGFLDDALKTNDVEAIATPIAQNAAQNAIGPATNALAQANAAEKTERQDADALLGEAIDRKQDTLSSGTNIKTINGESVLGSGNILVGSGMGTNEVKRLAFDAIDESGKLSMTNGPRRNIVWDGNRLVLNAKALASDDAFSIISGTDADYDPTKLNFLFGNYCKSRGNCSGAFGMYDWALGDASFAVGDGCTASGWSAIACGINAIAASVHSYAWQGYENEDGDYYEDHGAGTYNINPVGGVRGVWIGETNLATHLDAVYSAATNYTDEAVSRIVPPETKTTIVWSEDGFSKHHDVDGNLYGSGMTSVITGGMWTVQWKASGVLEKFFFKEKNFTIETYIWTNANNQTILYDASLGRNRGNITFVSSANVYATGDGSVVPTNYGVLPDWENVNLKAKFTAMEPSHIAPSDTPYDRFATTNDLANAVSRPQAPITETALKWRSDGSAIAVSVASSGTLGVDLTGWTVGQTQTALVTLAAGASVSSDIVLVGYNGWITGSPFIAECIRVSNKVYVNPICAVQ